jgi:hypothetical protein
MLNVPSISVPLSLFPQKYSVNYCWLCHHWICVGPSLTSTIWSSCKAVTCTRDSCYGSTVRWSIVVKKKNCFGQQSSGLPLHPREQGWMSDLEASSLSSQKAVQDSAVFRENYGYCCLGCSQSSFRRFHISRLNNKCRCLSWSTKDSPGGYSAQETRIVHKRSSFARQYSIPRRCGNRESLELLGAGKFFHIYHTVLIWHRLTSISSKRWKSISEFSAFPPMNMFKIKSRNCYVHRAHSFYEGLQYWYIAMASV